MSEKRSRIMDNLIAQDADLIDNPLVAAVRELLTDDSMEHLDTFTHNLVQALHKHGLEVIMATQLQALAARVKVSEAENGRLREALEESLALNINYHAVEEQDGYQFTEAPAVIEAARAALEPKP